MEVRVEPNAQELIAVIALLSRENDSLRERVGACGISFFERSFTRDDLAIGMGLGPVATVNPVGTVKIHLES